MNFKEYIDGFTDRYTQIELTLMELACKSVDETLAKRVQQSGGGPLKTNRQEEMRDLTLELLSDEKLQGNALYCLKWITEVYSKGRVEFEIPKDFPGFKE